MFNLGKVVVTRGIFEKMKDYAFNIFVQKSLAQYRNCDWGRLCAEDAKANDQAVKNGERILANYEDEDGTKIWIITEWDRSCTTILFPDEY